MDNEKILAECRMEFERHQSDEWKGCTECRFIEDGCWKHCSVVMKTMHFNGEFASRIPSGQGTELRAAIPVDHSAIESNEFWDEFQNQYLTVDLLYDGVESIIHSSAYDANDFTTDVF